MERVRISTNFDAFFETSPRTSPKASLSSLFANFLSKNVAKWSPMGPKILPKSSQSGLWNPVGFPLVPRGGPGGQKGTKSDQKSMIFCAVLVIVSGLIFVSCVMPSAYDFYFFLRPFVACELSLSLSPFHILSTSPPELTLFRESLHSRSENQGSVQNSYTLFVYRVTCLASPSRV